jgi:hypothetical protein
VNAVTEQSPRHFGKDVEYGEVERFADQWAGDTEQEIVVVEVFDTPDAERGRWVVGTPAVVESYLSSRHVTDYETQYEAGGVYA